MDKDNLYFLSKVELLSDLNAQELRELAADFRLVEYPQGADIIRQGQERHCFYVLVEGKVSAQVNKQQGSNSWPVNSFGPGDAFGEISLFSGNPSPVTIRCQQNCQVLVLDAEHFAAMLARWPKLYQRFIEKLSQNLNQVNLGLWEAKHKEFLRSALQQTHYEYKFYGIWGSPASTRKTEAKLAE